MTTIAFDGKFLAADGLCISNRKHFFKAQKIRVITIDGYSCLCGGAGRYDQVIHFMDWAERGADPDDWPSIIERDEITGFIIYPHGVYVFDGSPVPIKDDTLSAFGSGAKFAIGAMLAGANAIKAVELACLVDSDSGNGIYYAKFVSGKWRLYEK